jgi:hypothetical protein
MLHHAAITPARKREGPLSPLVENLSYKIMEAFSNNYVIEYMRHADRHENGLHGEQLFESLIGRESLSCRQRLRHAVQVWTSMHDDNRLSIITLYNSLADHLIPGFSQTGKTLAFCKLFIHHLSFILADDTGVYDQGDLSKTITCN